MTQKSSEQYFPISVMAAQQEDFIVIILKMFVTAIIRADESDKQ